MCLMFTQCSESGQDHEAVYYNEHYHYVLNMTVTDHPQIHKLGLHNMTSSIYHYNIEQESALHCVTLNVNVIFTETNRTKVILSSQHILYCISHVFMKSSRIKDSGYMHLLCVELNNTDGLQKRLTLHWRRLVWLPLHLCQLGLLSQRESCSRADTTGREVIVCATVFWWTHETLTFILPFIGIWLSL